MKKTKNTTTGFGQYLVEKGLISDEQRLRALELQSKDRLMEELALEFKMLSPDDLPAVHEYMAEHPALLFGEAAISQGLITFNQLRYLLDVRTKRKVRIGDILLQEGFISEEALRDILMTYHGEQKKFKKILIVDLSTTVIGILQRMLEKYDYQVKSCRSGAEGANLVKTFRPEIVIVSGELADMEGYTFCQQMLSEPVVVTRNYVLISSSLHQENVDRAFNAGVSHFLSKPVNEKELLNLVFQIEKDSLKKRPEKVLVVDDSVGPRMVISKELAGAGFEVFQAVNGAEAVRLAREIKPDLITMDVEMPVMGGFEACGQLCNHVETSDVPVIMISSLTTPEVVARGFEVGAVEFFGKPFKAGELANYVNALLETRKISKQERVLVVEDSPVVLHILKYLFRKNGYELFTAIDGLEGLQLAESVKPDIIITDCYMPAMNGWQLVTALKENSELSHIPVVMLTGSTEKDDVLRGLALGAADYITKPFDETELLARVVVHLDKKRLFDQMRHERSKLAAINRRQGRLLNEITILNRMGEAFQRCRSEVEVYAQVAIFFEEFYPTEGGILKIKGENADSFTEVISWGGIPSPASPNAKACPALKGEPPVYLAKGTVNGPCSHCQEQGCLVCAPLVSQGNLVGMIQRFAVGGKASTEAAEGGDYGGKWHLENTIFEHVGLAISNTRLRESLVQQSIRDPLTRLFNRRYMEESFIRELARVERNKTPLGVIMFDVDHFKKFNDNYGHMAGDVVLKRIAEIAVNNMRKADIVCRYGGEEFIIIMPEASLLHVVEKAEKLREALAHADNLVVEGQELPTSTISLGVALYPDHGRDSAKLIEKADEALYKAKAGGRNRVEVA